MRLFHKFYWMRRFGSTVRFHAERYVGDRQTVLHHSASTALLLLYAVPEQCTVNLLRACLQHDLEEGITGDIPAPTKWALGNGKLDALEARIRGHFQWDVPELTLAEQALLKAADFVDACFTCLEQRMLGNQFVDRMFMRYAESERATNLLDCAPALWELYCDIRGAFLSPGNAFVSQAEEQDFWKHCGA